MSDRVIPAPRLAEVADRIYAYVQLDGSWCLSNAGVLVGDRAVTLVDTAATEPRARALREAIGSVTPAPTRTLVNTHHHGDHTHGNCVFAADATIIGHDLVRQEMQEAGLLLKLLWPDVEWGDLEVVPPTVSFPDRLTLYVDDLEVQLFYVGVAHTTNDIVAWIPDRGVLFTGDVVFNGGTPFSLMGSVAGSLDALGTLRGLGATTVIPGHGGVGGPEIFETNIAYLSWVQETARTAVAAGVSPLEAAREVDLGQFAGLLDRERIVGNLHRAYAEERGEPRGVPLDYASIIWEMVEYNGGRPMACYA